MMNLREFSHYSRNMDGSFQLWSVETCDECGCDCLVLNPVRLSGRGLLAMIRRAGLVAGVVPRAELYACDVTDWYCCEGCCE